MIAWRRAAGGDGAPHRAGRIDVGLLQFDRLQPYILRSRSWWGERSPRERVLLAGLIAALALAALMLVIRSIQAERADAMARIHVAELLDARLRAGGFGQGSSPGQSLRMQRGSASAILSNSTAAARLTIDRIEPDGAGTRVVIADASFEQVLRWIADLEATSRLRVVGVSIARKSSGIVSATLVIAG